MAQARGNFFCPFRAIILVVSITCPTAEIIGGLFQIVAYTDRVTYTRLSQDRVGCLLFLSDFNKLTYSLFSQGIIFL